MFLSSYFDQDSDSDSSSYYTASSASPIRPRILYPIAIMAYLPWGVDQMLTAKDNWVNFDTFREFVVDVKSCQFHVKASREDLRVKISNLKGLAPYNRTLRFPADEIYVHLDNVELSQIILNLTQSLDQPDRQANVEHHAVSHQSTQDAKRSYDYHIKKLNAVLASRGDALSKFGILTRTTFEDKFALVFA
nr:MAG: coat protein [Mite martelli-like virus]